MSIKSTARAYVRDAVTAFDRAPAEVALAVFTATLMSYSIEGNHRFEAWVQIAVGAYIAFAIAWCATLLNAMQAISWRQRWAVTVGGAVVAALYLLLVETAELESEGWRAMMLVASVTLLVLAAPAWVRSSDPPSLRLRRINGRFALRVIGIGLYGLALFAGLALALGAINKLFELKLESEIYGHTFGWIMLVLVPWVIVGGLDSYFRPLDEESDVARVVHRLTAFLVPPLLVLYYLILFVYAIRIGITGELPKNLVSPMVIAAGLLTALAAVLFDPLPDDTRAGQRALRYAPALFIPLVPLGLWALGARIGEYGWTEFRLMRVLLLVLLLVLAVLATLQLVRRRAFSLRAIPIILALPVLFAAVGPWSVFRIARHDQEARLTAALREAGVLQRAAADTARKAVPIELYQRINSLGTYIESHFGKDALNKVVRGMPRPAFIHGGLADDLGLTPFGTDTMPWVTHGALPAGTEIQLDGARMYRVSGPGGMVQVRGSRVTFNVAGGPLHTTLDTIISQTPRGRQRRDQRPLPRILLPLTDESGNQRGHLVVFEATIFQKRDSVQIQRLDGILILR